MFHEKFNRFWLLPLLMSSALLAAEPKESTQGLHVKQTDAAITVYHNEQVLLAFNKQSPPVPEGMKEIYHRSGFIHPVNTPGGKTVTATFPIDHPHQHGIFTAWTKTTYDGRPIDFWNLAKGQGRVSFKKNSLGNPAVSMFEGSREPIAISFNVDLVHSIVADPPVDVLAETWQVTVYDLSPDDDSYSFEIKLKQTALTDKPLVIEEYHYGGFAVRGPTRWVLRSDGDDSTGNDAREPAWFLNNLGSNRVKGNHEHAHWVSMGGKIEGADASITVISEKSNFRWPQAARLHPTKPYFCYAPCVDGKFVIDKDHPYEAKYHFIVADKKMTAQEMKKRLAQ